MIRKLSVLLMAAFVAMTPLWSGHASAITLLTGGQKHYYTVQMRSDRQSITYAKIVFEAQHTDDLKTYEFSLPTGVTAENLSIQQILAKSSQKKCTTYETIEEWRKRQTTSTYYFNNSFNDGAYDSSKLCLSYDTTTGYDEDFDYDKNTSGSTYFTPEYYSTPDKTYEYKDITPKVDGSHYTLTLPVTIKAEKQGAILVSFTSRSYISGGLGYYNYDYRTFLTKQMIESATVAINFDEDLYSREASQQRTTETAPSAATDLSINSGANASYKSRSLTDLQLGVGRGGQVFKTQNKMLPDDTLSVKGVFSTNRFLLYGAEFLTALVIIALAVAGFFYYRRYRRAHPRPVATHADGTPVPAGSSRFIPTLRRTFTAPEGDIGIGRMVAVSLLSTALTAIAIFSLSGVYSALNPDSYAATPIVAAIAGTAVSFLLLITIPTLYVKTFSMRRVLQWSYIHVAVILVVAILIMALTANTSSNSYSPTPSCPNCIYN